MTAQSYLIAISEDQRVALLELIAKHGQPWTEETPANSGEPDGPLVYWEGMLEGLPNDEAMSPGVIHGFCW